MINKFLKAKHWHLFVLLFAIPLIIQLTLMITIVLQIVANPKIDPTELFSNIKFIPISTLIFTFLFFGWFWSIAIGLQQKIPRHIDMNIKLFKVFFFIPVIYFSCIFLFIGLLFNSDIQTIESFNPTYFGIFFLFFFLLHLFSIFCMFYNLYFVVKTLRTAELQRETTFGDFVGDFFLLWFFPIGVWFIQPRINKLMEENAIE